MNKKLITLTAALGLATSCYGQVVVANYDFASGYTSADTETNSTASALTPLDETEGVLFNSLFPEIDGGFGNALPSFTFYMGNINGGGDDSNPVNYVDFTVTPTGGATMDFTSLTLDLYKVSGGAEVTADLSWSVDSYVSSLGSGGITATGGWEQTLNAALTGLADQTTATTFRITFDTGGGTGSNQIYLDNIVLNANVTAVPEPSAFALLAGCFGLTWVMLRRR